MVRATLCLIAVIGVFTSPSLSVQIPPTGDALHRPLDELLDLYVRDGLVYYQALRSDRARLDQYVAGLDNSSVAAAYPNWNREQQAAFWVNAYNAFVLRTVIDNYPIRGRTSEYPSVSIRQIPGAFDKLLHRAAGRTLTLDTIENTMLSQFKDPRLYLTLGRGAVGSPRLHSEAYSGDRLQSQLTAVASECPTRVECILIDQTANRIDVTQVVSWHEAEFIAAYTTTDAAFANRRPLERAVLAFILPNLLATEREFLEKSDFRVSYSRFDWTLNDLTGRTR